MIMLMIIALLLPISGQCMSETAAHKVELEAIGF
jgi:hypothetical protein